MKHVMQVPKGSQVVQHVIDGTLRAEMPQTSEEAYRDAFHDQTGMKLPPTVEVDADQAAKAGKTLDELVAEEVKRQLAKPTLAKVKKS